MQRGAPSSPAESLFVCVGFFQLNDISHSLGSSEEPVFLADCTKGACKAGFVFRVMRSLSCSQTETKFSEMTGAGA